MKTFSGVFGHFHPVLVHLPIGFLLLALVFQWVSTREKYIQLKHAVKPAFLLGCISAVLSCVSGWLLSSGDYDREIVNFHQWFGIAVAIVSFIAYLLAGRISRLLQRLVSVILLLLIIITGHLGGTLTHGEGFLTNGWNKSDSASKKRTITDLQQAAVFADIVEPVLTDKCGSCHSAVKQKGGLRLDSPEWIIKGGKNGSVYTAGNASSSELFRRITLDPLEEEHMPPKGKPQLSEQEISLIHWWISSNAGFDKKVNEVNTPANILASLKSSLSSAPDQQPAVPSEEVAEADNQTVDSLRKLGIAVSPVSANSHYLQVNTVSIPQPGDHIVTLLGNLRKQLVWLKLPSAQLSASAWKTLASFTALTKLSIEHSNISDADIALFSSLQHLQYLNLVSTGISISGIQQIKNLHELQHLYLGKTNVKREEFAGLQKLFPSVILDSGNYSVANLATDTQLLKAPVRK